MSTEHKVPLAALALLALHIYGVSLWCMLAAGALLLSCRLHTRYFVVVSFSDRRPAVADARRRAARAYNVPLFYVSCKVVR